MSRLAKLPPGARLAPGSMPLFAEEPAFPPQPAEAAGVSVKDPGKAAVRALGRLQAGTMNGTEKAYAETLEARRLSGEVLWWKFEGIKLRLADNTFYTPDFLVMLADRSLEVHETKGHWEDDARVKIKVAQEAYPILRFVALKRLPKKDGGGWAEEMFG